MTLAPCSSPGQMQEKKKKVKMTWSRLDYDTNKKASPVTLAL